MPADPTLNSSEAMPPQDSVPRTRPQRDLLRAFVRQYAQSHRLVPPLSLEELRRHSVDVVSQAGLASTVVDYAAVLLNNEAWRETFSRIPYSRRLLLLPNCLRHSGNCPAQFDELGLLCEHCGRCVIHEIKTAAEQLGYAVLIAEGSPVVMALIESGRIEAVLGVSCLSVLERTFPYMEAGAVPGLAIPLLRDGCVDTTFDVDWLWETLYLNGDSEGRWLNIEGLRGRVGGFFDVESLEGLLVPGEGQVERIALEWLGTHGKRWRPTLLAGAFEALCPRPDSLQEQALRSAAVAVECFHKASLVHDDIEDDDDQRYGEETLHRRYGTAIALNVGDYLLGQGYALLAGPSIPASAVRDVLAIAAQGHRQLCVGQGRELEWMRRPRVLALDEVLAIFRGKTAPAFDVALKLGARLADADSALLPVLDEYSCCLGQAYQIRDDLEDFSGSPDDDVSAVRPSVLLAIACRGARGEDGRLLEQVCRREVPLPQVRDRVLRIMDELNVRAEAVALMESLKGRAMACLGRLDNAALKSLLRRVICRIFDDFHMMGCCDDHPRNDGPGRRPGRSTSE